ncbi:MAG TPA: adenylate/guanylate cyclase domain-containing protein [Actinomycetota bacterium]|nr:adenylate/guanylate cyclase domain-containing protein [Actinomycetota bacterium]
MASFTTAELAEAAGVPPAEVERLRGLGVMEVREGSDEYDEGTVAILRLALALEAGGIPLEVVGRAVREGTLSLAYAPLVLDETRSRTSGPSFRERCESMGLDPDFVGSFFEAGGLPRPGLDDPLRADDADALSVISLVTMVTRGRPEQVVRLARVVGEHVRWIAEAEADIYHEVVEQPALGSGADEREMRDAVSAASPMIRSLAEQLLLWLYRRHDEHATLEHLIEHVEGVVEDAGLVQQRRGTIPQAVAFVDLSGYTALTEERGDLAAVEVASRLAGVVDRVVRAHRGRPIKWLGDGVMILFRDPRDAVRATLETISTGAGEGLPAHAGVAAGPVVFRDGDVYGRTVNLAARISGRAGPGEVVVNSTCVEACRDDGVRFELLGEADLKGIAGTVELHRARLV